MPDRNNPLFRYNEWVVPIASRISEEYNYRWKQIDVRSHIGNPIKVKDRWWDNAGQTWIYTAARVQYDERELMLKEEYVQLKKGSKFHMSAEDFCCLL